MKRAPAIFFRTAAGNEPVREWLRAMAAADRRRIGEDIKTVEFGWPIGMPACRPLGDGLHEVRTNLGDGRIARVFFYVDRVQRMILLHGLVEDAANARARLGAGTGQQAQTRKELDMSRKATGRAARHDGSALDSLLEAEGILEEVEAVAVKRVIAWQIEQAMKAKKISKKRMAAAMRTSRSQLDRLLDPENAAVHLETITRAARVIGKKVRLRLIDAA